MAENMQHDPEGLLGRIRRLEDALATERSLRQRYELSASQLADEVKECRRTIANLQLENERLVSGHFTEGEFQNLCHNLRVDDKPLDAEVVCRFKQGCETYWYKLFGDLASTPPNFTQERK
jgi:chromosome segregation ATPase